MKSYLKENSKNLNYLNNIFLCNITIYKCEHLRTQRRDSKYYRAPTHCILNKKSSSYKLNDKFKSFNIKNIHVKSKNIRCGVIIFDPTFEYIVCITK